MSQTDEQKWDAGGSVHFEHRPHAEGGTRVAMLRHPNNPFRRIVGPTTRTAFDATAQAAANAYLQALAQANDLTRYATLLEQLFSTKITEHHMQLRWRPISWSSAGLIDPRDSFWVERYDDPQNSPNVRNFQDRTLVLLAVMHYRSSTATKEADLHPQRGSHGLRVVAHLRAREEIPELHFVGLSTSLLGYECEHNDVDKKFVDGWHTNLFGEEFGTPITSHPNLSGKNSSSVFTLDAFATSASNSLPYPLTFFRTLTHDSSTGRTSVVDRPMVTHAEAVAQPRTIAVPYLKPHTADDTNPQRAGLISQRPSFRQVMLPPQAVAPLPIPPVSTAGKASSLEDADARFRVLYSKHALRESKVTRKTGKFGQSRLETRFARLDEAAHPLTDKFAAISAYRHTADLFETLRANGFDARQYFSQYSLPLKVIPRSAIWPVGIDGNTINAQVNVAGNWEHPGVGSKKWTKARPQLEVRFAYANLLANYARNDSDKKLSYERLGLATDARWAWHEFGHVLIAATTGELELRFVHSVGDALAAIRSDPESALTEQARMRGVTFPWVALTRRHDRCAHDGWSWEGAMHRPSAFWVGGPNERSIKGYTTEQIMSSSLFMLYRALGGDTLDAEKKPDRVARREASDFVCYLIIRALALLGPASAVPADSVDQFVSALIDADIGTNDWRGRRGGAAHKVIVWAFEQQGLKAITRPVDLFIQSQRDTKGGYTPASLDDGVSSPWHASKSAITQSRGVLSVTVGNAGANDAQKVVASAWVMSIRTGRAKSPNWVALTELQNQSVMIVSGAEHLFRFDTHAQKLKGEHWVFVSTTCSADPSNNTLSTHLPCSTNGPRRLVDFVASDNNLGLTRIKF